MSRWIRPGDDVEWAALFTGFTATAFRLEGQQVYSSDVEDVALARFRAGEPHGVDLSWTLSKLREQRAAGRAQTLVRVVLEPPTDYTRMELTVYVEMAAAGQDTRVLPAPSGHWPDGVPRHDFWLFDDRRVWRLHYTDDHRWAGAELLDDEASIADHLRWRDTVLAGAVPLDVYLASRIG
jgi:hypothetical protein